jgi:hypothetical protein
MILTTFVNKTTSCKQKTSLTAVSVTDELAAFVNSGRSPQLILDEPGDSRNQWDRHPSNSK